MSGLVMRTGTANMFDSAVRNIGTRQTELLQLQENLTSGKRVVRPSDDPTSAANAERALNRISRITADQRALESQRNAITQAEAVLGDVTNALHRFRELVVSAGNASHSPAERRSIALELQGLRDQVFTLANTNDTNGMPLFSALGSALAPFVGPQASAPDYTFNGLPGQSASTDVSIPYALDGDSAFMLQSARDGAYNVTLDTPPANRTLTTSGVTIANAALITGNSHQIAVTGIDSTTTPGTTVVSYDVTETLPDTTTVTTSYVDVGYPTGSPASISVQGLAGLNLTLQGDPAVGDTLSVSPNPSLFSVLDDAIRDIREAPNNNAALQAVGQALHNVDIGMERVSAARGQAGDLLNRVDRISGNQEKRSIQLEADRSRAEDLDMVKGISQFNTQQTGYQAALQTYAKVQQLSLFNFIN